MLRGLFYAPSRLVPTCTAAPWQLISQAQLSDEVPRISDIWRNDYQWSLPVTFLAETQPPTALQWARRRGPGLNHAQLHSLFRKRQIKLFLPATAQVKSISERAQLPEGSQLLFPTQATAGQPASRSTSLSQPDLTTKAALALAELLRQSVLHKDDELLVINKPAGLAVQGGPGVKLSLDKIMGSALSFGSLEQPRLVHRLDRDASGCLVIARTADSAAWLSQAFAQHAIAASSPDAVYTGATVQRVYLAMVEKSEHLALNPQGVIKDPLMGPGGSLQLATTLYRVLHSNDDVALMQLTPKTGRKHQLRIHCARALSAPILGDARYGMTRNDVQRKVLADLNTFNSQVDRATLRSDQAVDSTDMPVAHAEADHTTADMRNDLESCGALSVMPLQLHCQTVCLRKPRQQAIGVTSEPSHSMQALMRLFGWRTT
ncbi:hypothetical protein WJX77_005953 [Trebouxia sp. C0004]